MQKDSDRWSRSLLQERKLNTLPPERTQPKKLCTANFSSGTLKTLIVGGGDKMQSWNWPVPTSGIIFQFGNIAAVTGLWTATTCSTGTKLGTCDYE